jgi:hypothetical protein
VDDHAATSRNGEARVTNQAPTLPALREGDRREYRCRVGGIILGLKLDREGRPCARCGAWFRRTPGRWMTCQSCYLENSEMEPLASRVSSAGWRRRQPLDTDG